MSAIFSHNLATLQYLGSGNPNREVIGFNAAVVAALIQAQENNNPTTERPKS